MQDLALSPHPLVFPVFADASAWRPAAGPVAPPLRLRTSARALAGMQKEAVVGGSNGPLWRLVCDEGPYLLGTDLAPFPLAFFCVGMVSSYFMELAALAESRGLRGDWRLQQDNRYTMEGSATAGTMRGSALPVDLQLVSADSTLNAALAPLLIEAVAQSTAGGLLRTPTTGCFALQHGGRALELPVTAASLAGLQRPQGFEDLLPETSLGFPPDIISKLRTASVREGVSGGVGTSLSNEQKRTLHMQGVCRRRDDGLLEVSVDLFSPLGSRFRFLVEPAEQCLAPRAPSPAMYLSAGIAFCFLTQMGRYAHIVRRPLSDYRLVQDSALALPGTAGRAAPAMAPLQTAVFIDSSSDDEHARQVVLMSEQTCFLHAACRQRVGVRLKPPLQFAGGQD